MPRGRKISGLRHFFDMALINGLLQWLFTILVCLGVFFTTLFFSPQNVQASLIFAAIVVVGHLILFLRRR